jgi:hypothetical protein
MSLEHIKSNDEREQTAGNAKIIKADVKECQDLFPKDGCGDQQYGNRGAGDEQDPMSSHTLRALRQALKQV